MRINIFQRAKIAVQELPHQFAEELLVVRKANLRHGDAFRFQRPHQQLDLRAFSGAVNPFNNDEFSARSHRFLPVYHTLARRTSIAAIPARLATTC